MYLLNNQTDMLEQTSEFASSWSRPVSPRLPSRAQTGTSDHRQPASGVAKQRRTISEKQ